MINRHKVLSTLSLGVLALSSAAAQDYFPLHPGNQWIYRVGGFAAGGHKVVEIVREDIIDNRAYSLLRGLEVNDVYLRQSEDGTLYAYDPDTNIESVWAVFSTPEGQSYRTSINECNHTAKVESRSAEVKLPIGDVVNALEVSYPGANCADAGLTADHFLPYIGLVRREVTTIGGPRAFELIYARIGGVTVLSAPQVSFTLTLDRAVYERGDQTPVMTARMTLRVTRQPLELTFPSGQRFDVVLRNEAGREVFRWSDGKAFTLALGSETIQNGEKNYITEIPLRLPAGKYTAEGWLTTIGAKAYAATVGFEITAR
jgi:hypothetical protein